jgi:hypothetical protein
LADLHDAADPEARRQALFMGATKPIVGEEWVYWLEFDRDGRFDILHGMQKMNIRYATLFRGLDGPAKSLKTDAETGTGQFR